MFTISQNGCRLIIYTKGYSMEEILELAGFTDADIPRLEEFKRNQYD